MRALRFLRRAALALLLGLMVMASSRSAVKPRIKLKTFLLAPVSDITDAAPFERTRRDAWRIQVASALIISALHFNDRNHTIIPQHVTKNCDVDIDFVFYDTLGKRLYALQPLVEADPRPKLIAGASLSASSVSLALASSVLGIPQNSYLSTSTQLSNVDTYPLFSRVIPPDNSAAAALMALFGGWRHKAVNVLFVNDEYGSSYNEALRTFAAIYDISLNSVAYEKGSTDSTRRAISSGVDRSLNGFVCVGFTKDVDSIILHSQKLGLIGVGKIWIFTDGVSPGDLSAAAQKASVGSMRVVAGNKPNEIPQYRRFAKAWPSFGELRQRINTHLPGGILAGQDAAPVPFAVQLDENFFDLPLDSRAALGFDSVLALGAAACDVFRAQGRTSLFRGEDVHAALINSTLDGASGVLRFLPNGDRDSTSMGGVRADSFRPNGKTEFAGLWKGKNWVFAPNLQFAGGASEPPPFANPVDEDKHATSRAAIALCILFVSIISSMCIVLSAWVAAHKTVPLVKAGQPVFLQFILWGTLISSFASVPIILDDTIASPAGASFACMATPWLYSVGFVITYSALLVKTYRVSVVFKAALTFKRFVVPVKRLFAGMATLVVVDMLILLCWSLVAPLKFVRTPLQVDRFGRVLESFGACTTENAGGFVATMAVLHMFLLAAAAWIAFDVRNVPGVFHESRHLMLAFLCQLQLFAVFLPALAAVYESPMGRSLVLLGVVFVNGLVLVGVVFLPKILVYYNLTSDEPPIRLMDTTRGGGDDDSEANNENTHSRMGSKFESRKLSSSRPTSLAQV